MYTFKAFHVLGIFDTSLPKGAIVGGEGGLQFSGLGASPRNFWKFSNGLSISRMTSFYHCSSIPYGVWRSQFMHICEYYKASNREYENFKLKSICVNSSQKKALRNTSGWEWRHYLCVGHDLKIYRFYFSNTMMEVTVASWMAVSQSVLNRMVWFIAEILHNGNKSQGERPIKDWGRLSLTFSMQLPLWNVATAFYR